jgi:hypothetical protein
VPAAAVIPAPIAYTKIVAVKKLVVGSAVSDGGPPMGGHCRSRPTHVDRFQRRLVGEASRFSLHLPPTVPFTGRRRRPERLL